MTRVLPQASTWAQVGTIYGFKGSKRVSFIDLDVQSNGGYNPTV